MEKVKADFSTHNKNGLELLCTSICMFIHVWNTAEEMECVFELVEKMGYEHFSHLSIGLHILLSLEVTIESAS